MPGHQMLRRQAHRRRAAFDRRRQRGRLHYHQTAFCPEPWGRLALPVTFSTGAYEQQSNWFGQLTGTTSFVGGPLSLNGLPGCRCAAWTIPPRRRTMPYWQIPIDESTARAMREAASAEREQQWAAYANHRTWHAEDDFLALVNCHDPTHDRAPAPGRVAVPIEA